MYSRLQIIPKNVVKSIIPIEKVMENLFMTVDIPQNIYVSEMVTTFSYAMNFVGTANVDFVKVRQYKEGFAQTNARTLS